MIETMSVMLARSRTASGGWEWFFVLDGVRIYPNVHRVGVFTIADMTFAEAFPLVLNAWVRG